ncbi:MAG: glycoside hydrolase family 57 protein [Bryobacteraceae bacterium]
MTGSLAIVLHAHLPYVRHPEHQEFLEENWYYEAAVECYLPLIDALRRLKEDEVPFALTLNLSPTLVEMMRDPLLSGRLGRRIENLLELCAKEMCRPWSQTEERVLARFYQHRLLALREVLDGFCERDLSAGFSKLAGECGELELLGCAATHGFLPFLVSQPAAARAQIAVGISSHRERFGSAPAGIWLPECAYDPRLDAPLAANGIRYFLVETHGLLHGKPAPRYGTLRPVVTEGGLIAFGRDEASARQVWSAVEGYPGDPFYREFYRDIGRARPRCYIRRHLPAGLPFDTGLKYHRVTGPTEEKLWYRRAAAIARTREHATHFVGRRIQHLEQARDVPNPIIVAPYDAELFGHWWFEGPEWLEQVFRAAQGKLGTATLSSYAEEHSPTETVRLGFSSWGEHGYGDVWLNPQTDWIYPRLHRMANSMTGMARRFERPTHLERRALKQAARELLLAQASDWPFLIRRGGAPHYAQARLRMHMDNFAAIERALEASCVRRKLVEPMEERMCPFPEIDYRVYA